MSAWEPLRRREGTVLDPDGIEGQLWENDRYQVISRRHAAGPLGPFLHLTIRNRDGSVRRDWRDFQRIKNELGGDECEAVELYPAESRVVDTANHYHLWVLLEHRFPFGMEVGERSDGGEEVSQRPHQGGSAAG